jgi:hypothetical protein
MARSQTDILFTEQFRCLPRTKLFASAQMYKCPCALSCKLYTDIKVLACYAHRQRYGLMSGVTGLNLGHVIDYLYRLFRGFLNKSEAVP